MARGKKAREPEVEEVKTKDFERAVKTFKNDIKPANTQAASHNQVAGEGYKHIKKICHIQPDAARKAFKVCEMEDAHRDDWFRSFSGTINEMLGYEALTFNTNDLVDQMQGGGLATLGNVDDEFDEASEEELAGQKSRPGNVGDEPAAGTGAAAIAAMKQSAAEPATIN